MAGSEEDDEKEYVVGRIDIGIGKVDTGPESSFRESWLTAQSRFKS